MVKGQEILPLNLHRFSDKLGGEIDSYRSINHTVYVNLNDLPYMNVITPPIFTCVILIVSFFASVEIQKNLLCYFKSLEILGVVQKF